MSIGPCLSWALQFLSFHKHLKSTAVVLTKYPQMFDQSQPVMTASLNFIDEDLQ